MGEAMILVIPAAFFCGAALVGWALARFAPPWVWKIVAGLCGAAFLALAVLSQAASGWDALGHFIAAALMALPALLGLLLGAYLARRR